eukprot:1420831-Lingulodinium_polyedra.AAC.1
MSSSRALCVVVRSCIVRRRVAVCGVWLSVFARSCARLCQGVWRCVRSRRAVAHCFDASCVVGCGCAAYYGVVRLCYVGVAEPRLAMGCISTSTATLKESSNPLNAWQEQVAR